MDHWEVHTVGTDGKVRFEASEDSTAYGLSANALAAFCPNDTAPLAERTVKRFMEAGRSHRPVVDVAPTLAGTEFPIVVPPAFSIPRLTR